MKIMKQILSLALVVFSISLFAQSKPEVLSAWYGVEGNAAAVTQKLKEVVDKYGFIVIPADMWHFYGFDPVPGVAKSTGLHVRHDGKEMHLRAKEGVPFLFPPNVDQSRARQALAAIQPSRTKTISKSNNGQANPEILSAWYGVSDDPKYSAFNAAYAPKVTQKLREVVDKYGFIVIPADMWHFYGFDPVPGVHKMTGLHIRHDGKEMHLRAKEGVPFLFPANVDQSKAQQALADIQRQHITTNTQQVNVTLPIPAEELEQEVGRALVTTYPSANEQAHISSNILLPPKNGSEGSIIVSGIAGRKILHGYVFILKLISDNKGNYSIDRTFGSNSARGANPRWKTNNGIMFVWGAIETLAGFSDVCLLPGDKSDEFRINLSLHQRFSGKVCPISDIITANDRGEIVDLHGLDYSR